MVRRICFIILWTVVLPTIATVTAALLAVAYSKAVIAATGSRPSAEAVHVMENIWTYTGMIMMPVALLLGIFGFLPGTRSGAGRG